MINKESTLLNDIRRLCLLRANHQKTFEKFLQCFSQLPPEKARSVFAVYAFCRQADDAIDRYQDIVKLNELEHGLRQMACGKVLDTLYGGLFLLSLRNMIYSSSHFMICSQDRGWI